MVFSLELLPHEDELLFARGGATREIRLSMERDGKPLRALFIQELGQADLGNCRLAGYQPNY